MKQPQLPVLWLWAILAIPSILHAGPPQPATALVVRNSATGANEFSSVVEYSKVDFQSAVALRVILPDGKTLSIPRSEIAVVFQYPDPMATLSGSTDAPGLSAKRAEAISLGTRFPNAKPAIRQVISGIDGDLQKLAAGQVRYSGVWQTPAATASSGSSSVDLPSLTYKGRTYSHLTLSRLDNGSIILTHEGGVLRLPLIEASPELLRVLRGKPDLLSGIRRVAELTVDNIRLTGVLVVGVEGENLILLHDGGVLSTPQAKLSSEQKGMLALNTEASRPPSSTPADPVQTSAQEQGKTTLVFGEGSGKRDPVLGWRCPPAERAQWLAAGEEPFNTDPRELTTFWRVQLGAMPPEGQPILKGPIPEYPEIIAFLNSKLPVKVSYNETNHCLVLYSVEKGQRQIRIAMLPGKVNAGVRFGSQGRRGVIRLEGLNGADAFVLYEQTTSGKEERLWRKNASGIQLLVAEPDDAERAAKAWRILLVMLGARDGSF